MWTARSVFFGKYWQPVGVLFRAALPGRLRVAGLDGYVRGDAEALVRGELQATVAGEAGAQLRRQRLHLGRMSVDHRLCILALHLDEEYEARLTLDQCGDVRVGGAGEQVAFPVAGKTRSSTSGGRSLIEIASVMPPRLCPLRLALFDWRIVCLVPRWAVSSLASTPRAWTKRLRLGGYLQSPAPRRRRLIVEGARPRWPRSRAASGRQPVRVRSLHAR